MINKLFKSYDFQYFDTSDYDLATLDVGAEIELLLSIADEHLEIELQHKLERATYPRYGFTLSQRFTNADEYAAFLRDVAQEERDDGRDQLALHLINME